MLSVERTGISFSDESGFGYARISRTRSMSRMDEEMEKRTLHSSTVASHAVLGKGR